MASLKKSLPFYFTILSIIFFIFLSIELISNPNTIQKYFYIPSSTLIILVCIITVYSRLKNVRLISTFLYKLVFLLFPITLFVSVSLSIIDFFTPANFIFSRFGLNYDRLFFISLLLLIFLLLYQSNTFFKKNYTKLILIFEILFLSVLGVISTWPFDRFLQIVKEDNVIEYLQFFTLLSGGIISFLFANLLWHRKKKIFSFIFIFVAIGLLAVAGDEVSWGQRIIGLETPTKIKELNYQNEMGFHNTIYIDGFVPFIYMLAGAYGTFMHFLKDKLSKTLSQDITSLFIPPGHLALFFLLPFLYNLYSLGWEHNFGRWSEVAELYLDLGVTIFISENFFLTKKAKNT